MMAEVVKVEEVKLGGLTFEELGTLRGLVVAEFDRLARDLLISYRALMLKTGGKPADAESVAAERAVVELADHPLAELKRKLEALVPKPEAAEKVAVLGPKV